MKRIVAIIYIVSWMGNMQYQKVTCGCQEAKEIVCVSPYQSRIERDFKNKEAADAFYGVLIEDKFPDVRLEKRDK